MLKYFNGHVLFPALEKLKKREISAKKDELVKFDLLSSAEQLQRQKEYLHKLLHYCNEHIPYYRELFKEKSFDIDSVLADINNLKNLPVLTKQDIKNHSAKLRKKSVYLHPRKTGGSTGQSVLFYYDQEGLDWTSAINLRALEMAHKYPHHTDCHISSELSLTPPSFKYRFLDGLKLFSQNRKRLMITSFTDENLKKFYSQLKRIRPYLLQGHPSSLYALSEFIRRQKLPRVQLCRVFEPSGEMLTPKIVDSIESHIGCKVVNRYGNAEFGVMAHSNFEDPYTKLKVFRRNFIIEECTQNNLIVTGLTNYGFPLLRYDTGDIGTVKEEVDGTYLYDIQGREHDLVLINNELFATHYIMDFLDHKVTKVREFQIILRENSSVPILNIVPEKNEDTERIQKLIKEKWRDGLHLNFITYDELERVGWRQKFRHVIDQRDNK